jgi:branched-chain amino acid transport system substrate-binding protein
MKSSDPIKIGLLFSKQGVTSQLESSQLYGALFAIDEINGLGGVQGREIIPTHYDPKSDNTRYEVLLERLIIEDHINLVFGGYTSTSRKAMLPIIEKYNKLLFYPQQYEGFEFSENIIYTGAAPNQNLVQLEKFMTLKFGARVYMIGSNYIYPYETNRNMCSLIAVNPAYQIVAERYVSMYADKNSIDQIVAEIKVKQPDFVFCTLIGRTVPYFYQAYLEAGLDPAKIPVASLNTSEVEINIMGVEAAMGHYTSSPYFQSIDLPLNRNTVDRFFASRYSERAIPNMNWEASYFAMHLLAKALRNSDSDRVEDVLPNILGAEIEAPQGRVQIDHFTHHASLYPRIGMANSDGQFTIIEDSGLRINPDPYMVRSQPVATQNHSLI